MTSLPVTPGPFPVGPAALYEALQGRGDVDIARLFAAVFPDAQPTELRAMQQKLGPYITRLNRRLKTRRQAVKPGRLKGTYTLVLL